MCLPIRRIVPRFRLRTLLIAVAIIGVGCALVGDRYVRGRREHAAVEAMQRTGVGIVFITYDYEVDASGRYLHRAEPSAPEWLRSFLGDEFFNHVVDFKSADVQDASVFRNLKDTPYLRMLYLVSPNLTDERLAYLAELNDLEHLDLAGCPVTDEGIKKLSALKKLSRLRLYNTRVTLAGRAALRQLMPQTAITLYEGRSVRSER